MRCASFACASAALLLVSAGTAHAADDTARPAVALPSEPAVSSEIARSPDLTISLGGALWHGDYGAPTNTDIRSVLVGARYRIGGVRLSAAIPYMRIRSDGTFFAGIGGTPLFVAPNVRPLRRTRDGIGDLTLGASYLAPGGGGMPVDIEFTGRVKLPTASDSSGLSTGKTDYSAGVELSRGIGRLTPAASATYRIYGDNRQWRFRDGFVLTAGAAYALSTRGTLLLSYEYSEASSRFIGDAHELVLGGSLPIADTRLRLTGYGSAGLSRGASDVSAGISLAAGF